MGVERRTERMRLVLARPDDVDALLALDGDPEAMRFLDPSTRLQVEERIADPGRRLFLAYEDGEFIGVLSLRWTDPRDVELGYRLRPAHWGKGLATEGARWIIALAFDELGTERVWAQTMALNTPSRRVMERCGMRFLRTFHLQWDAPLPGAEHGEVEYELLRPPSQGSGWTSNQNPDQEA